MRVYYYQRRDRVANFGDDLNLWLWERLIPDVLVQVDNTVLVGLGTVVNDALPNRLGNVSRVVLFSSGVGYERPLRQIPTHWQIYCLRGPRSTQLLRLPDHWAVTDGGVLLRRLVPRIAQPLGHIAVMPHVHHATSASAAWQLVCQDLGFVYVDPRWPVIQVIETLQQSRLVLSEAMHGAIAADALGIPWIPLATSPRILSFKWQDWCASIRQPYRPVYIPPLTDYPPYGQGLRSARRAALHWAGWFSQGALGLGQARCDRMATLLADAVDHRQPYLCDRTLLESLTQQLEERLEQLCRDHLSTGD